MSEFRSLDFDSSPAILENHSFFFASASGMLRWVTGGSTLGERPPWYCYGGSQELFVEVVNREELFYRNSDWSEKTTSSSV